MAPSARYVYRIKARNAGGLSEQNEWFDADMPPAKPTSLTGTVSQDSVSLSWDAPGDESIKGYQILRRRPTMGENTLVVFGEDTGSTATTFTDTDVTAGIWHVYRV